MGHDARLAAERLQLEYSDEAKRRESRQRRERLRKEALEKATEWAKSNGYQDINTAKTAFHCNRLPSHKYPLHTAVKNNNKDMVRCLLLAGAQKDVKDSSNVTPRQLAERLNKSGSHRDTIAMLR